MRLERIILIQSGKTNARQSRMPMKTVQSRRSVLGGLGLAPLAAAQYARRQLLGAAGAGVVLAGRAGAAQKPMRGIFPIIVTPYTAKKEIDYEDLAAEAGFLERCGVHGMVWPQIAS